MYIALHPVRREFYKSDLYVSHDMASNVRMAGERWIGKDLEGYDDVLIVVSLRHSPRKTERNHER
jgi:hypothetical protein